MLSETTKQAEGCLASNLQPEPPVKDAGRLVAGATPLLASVTVNTARRSLVTDWSRVQVHPDPNDILCFSQPGILVYIQVYEECGGPARILQFLAGCSDSMLLETGLHHMHQACTASPLLCATWAGQGSMELALAVAADSTWPLRVRRSALLLVSVLCRGSPDAARQFLQLEVSLSFVLFHLLETSES